MCDIRNVRSAITLLLFAKLILLGQVELINAQLEIRVYSTSHVDVHGNPNFLRAINDPEFGEVLGLSEEHLKSLRSLRHEVKNPTHTLARGHEFDLEKHRLLTKLGHQKVESQLRARLGDAITDEIISTSYRSFIAEKSVLEFLALPEIADELGISRSMLEGIRSDGELIQKKFSHRVRTVLANAFDASISILDARQKEHLFRELKISPGSNMPAWVLRGAYIGNRNIRVRSVFLASEKLPIDNGIFDLLLLLNERTFSALEVVETQRKEIEALKRGNKESAELTNRKVSSILLPHQMRDLWWFAWREVYFRKGLPDFLSNDFVTTQLGLSEDQVRQIEKRTERICREASNEVDILAKEMLSEFAELLDEDQTRLFKRMVGVGKSP